MKILIFTILQRVSNPAFQGKLHNSQQNPYCLLVFLSEYLLTMIIFIIHSSLLLLTSSIPVHLVWLSPTILFFQFYLFFSCPNTITCLRFINVKSNAHVCLLRMTSQTFVCLLAGLFFKRTLYRQVNMTYRFSKFSSHFHSLF